MKTIIITYDSPSFTHARNAVINMEDEIEYPTAPDYSETIKERNKRIRGLINRYAERAKAILIERLNLDPNTTKFGGCEVYNSEDIIFLNE